MRSLDEFSKLVEDYAEYMDFIIVYLSEAHPTDGWKFEGNYDITQHTIQNERIEAAHILQEKLIQQLGQKKANLMPIYVDLMDNRFCELFSAFPERLLVIENNTLTYLGGMGPFLYSIPEVRQFFTSKFKKSPDY